MDHPVQKALAIAPGLFAYQGGVRLPETLDVDALLTGSQAASYAGVTLATICTWRSRGYLLRGSKTRAWLPVATDARGREIRDSHGRPKYRLLDVAKAEAATSVRARRAA